jgi:hypothetical protein
MKFKLKIIKIRRMELMDPNSALMNNLMTLLGITGLIQGLGMKYSTAVRKKLRLDREGIDKKYMGFKINFLIISGIMLLMIQLMVYLNPSFGEKMQILLSAFLLLAITSDMIYKKIRGKKASKTNYKKRN